MRFPLRGLITIVLLSGLIGCADDQSSGRTISIDGLERSYVDDATCPPPRCFETRIPHPEDINVSEDRVRIILPAGYDASSRSYPILYLLHDAPGDYLIWTQVGDAYNKLLDQEVIAVMPDGGGGMPGWYSDWFDGSYQWETFHMDVMLPYLESKLRVLGEGHRAIAGPSMGGYGAMRYSTAYPGRFEAAAGFSGAVDFLHLDQVSALYSFLAGFSGVTPGEAIWGDPVQHYDIWEAHDPGTHVNNILDMRIYLTSGNGMPGGPYENLPAGAAEYGIEPFLLIMNQSFADTLAASGVEHETWFYGPGFHNWPYYRDAFDWALPKLLKAIAP